MRNNKSLSLLVLTLSASFIFYSSQKSIEAPSNVDEIGTQANKSKPDITSYKFERINENNLFSHGWLEQQVNIIGTTTNFSELSDHVEIVCGPDNDTDPRLIQGSITMNLPTSGGPTLRRIRLRRGGYSGTRLADLTDLKYSTYVVHNS